MKRFAYLFSYILYIILKFMAILSKIQIEDDAYQEDLGYTRGTIGKAGTGRIRTAQVDEKTKVRISKTLQKNLQKQQVWGGSTSVRKQVSGTASSVAFTPSQVIKKFKNLKNYVSMGKQRHTGHKGKLLFCLQVSVQNRNSLCAPPMLLLVHRSVVFKIFLFTYFY